MARDLAIDLGTANTLVYMQGRGIVINELQLLRLIAKLEKCSQLAKKHGE